MTILGFLFCTEWFVNCQHNGLQFARCIVRYDAATAVVSTAVPTHIQGDLAAATAMLLPGVLPHLLAGAQQTFGLGFAPHAVRFLSY